MAATDQIAIQKVYTDPVSSTTSLGVEEKVTLLQFQAAMGVGAAAGSQGVVIRQTAPAAAAVPFASLTDAATSFNALRTALIAAGVLI